MEKKVYEGYKRTSSSGRTTTSRSTAAQKPSATDQEVAPQTKTPKRPNARPAGKSSVQKPRLAMFIDVDNVGISRENLLEILFYANGKYQIELCKLYGFNDETLPGIREIATEYNLVTVNKMKFKQAGTNCLDSRLLVDAYECALNNKQKIDMIFLWCYPCDLEDLFEKIVALGVNTATIDNNIFDCKNKFVSQAFKLYSPYNFNFTQPMYGKVQNQPSNIAPSEHIEPTPAATASVPNQPTENPMPQTPPTQPTTVDGVVPPILPRRSIPERSNPNKPKPEVEINDAETSTGTSSLVEEIARKLNIPMPSNDQISEEIERFENQSNVNSSNIFMDMLKQAGFNDLVEDKKVVKYEDTIGDL